MDALWRPPTATEGEGYGPLKTRDNWPDPIQKFKVFEAFEEPAAELDCHQ